MTADAITSPSMGTSTRYRVPDKSRDMLSLLAPVMHVYRSKVRAGNLLGLQPCYPIMVGREAKGTRNWARENARLEARFRTHNKTLRRGRPLWSPWWARCRGRVNRATTRVGPTGPVPKSFVR